MLKPERRQEVDDALPRKVPGAFELHVLDEMRQPLLVVVFEHRPGLDDEPQFGAVRRLAVRRARSSAGRSAACRRPLPGRPASAATGRRRRPRRRWRPGPAVAAPEPPRPRHTTAAHRPGRQDGDVPMSCSDPTGRLPPVAWRVPFSHGSKARLTRHDLGRFSAGTLFDRIGRAVCLAECLPRKELYEAWEVAPPRPPDLPRRPRHGSRRRSRSAGAHSPAAR